MLECKCWYSGPMKMERNSEGCPIHGTDKYSKMDSIIIYQLHGAENGIRRAVENNGDVVAAIHKVRAILNELEQIATS